MMSTKNVNICDDKIEKPFIGGFYKICDGFKTEYHNAFSQTGPIRKSSNFAESRCSQTVFLQNKTTNSNQSKCLQTGFYDVNAKVITCSGKINKYDSSVQKKIDRIVFLQKAFRKMKLRIWIGELLKKCRQIIDERKQNESLANKQNFDEIQRLFKPNNYRDFRILYGLIANWIGEKNSRFSSRKKKMILIAKEVEMLKKLDRKFERFLQLKSKKEFQYDVIRNLSEPIKWKNHRDLTIEMEPVYLKPEIKLIWKNLCGSNIDRAFLVREFSKCLEQLKNTEGDRKKKLFLKRQIEIWISQLENFNAGLNSIRNLKLIYIEYLKFINYKNLLPQKIQKLTNLKLYFCNKCANLKNSTDFETDEYQKFGLKVCQQCSWLNRTNRLNWLDYKRIYRQQLIRIREKEIEKFPNQSLEMFCVTENDIQFLCERVWHSRSAISDKQSNLILSRWNLRQAWSPWNCILLAEDEAEIHCEHNLDGGLENNYCSELIELVQLRNYFAKEKFFGKVLNEMKILQFLELI